MAESFMGAASARRAVIKGLLKLVMRMILMSDDINVCPTPFGLSP